MWTSYIIIGIQTLCLFTVTSVDLCDVMCGCTTHNHNTIKTLWCFIVLNQWNTDFWILSSKITVTTFLLALSSGLGCIEN